MPVYFKPFFEPTVGILGKVVDGAVEFMLPIHEMPSFLLRVSIQNMSSPIFMCTPLREYNCLCFTGVYYKGIMRGADENLFDLIGSIKT